MAHKEPSFDFNLVETLGFNSYGSMINEFDKLKKFRLHKVIKTKYTSTQYLNLQQ